VAAPIIDNRPPTIQSLIDLIAALRGDSGCPWDRKQTPSTLTVYLIEEMFELVEAINTNNPDGVLEELGDVLFQILFVVQMYQHDGQFSLEQVLERIIRKMIRRHPHVFGSKNVENAEEVKAQWRRIKQQEKDAQESLLDSIPSGMPALMKAYRVSERAAGTGFDWDSLEGVMTHARQEWGEFEAEVDKPNAIEANKQKITMELGDVLFSLVNVARLAKVHPETALSRSTQKFIRRFKQMEAMAAEENHRLEGLSKDEMEQLWNKAKNDDPPGE
jgi:tetrapyrrole methylase family protein/MazG family protein